MLGKIGGIVQLPRTFDLHSKDRGLESHYLHKSDNQIVMLSDLWDRMFQGFGDRHLQCPCGGFDSHRLHKNAG